MERNVKRLLLRKTDVLKTFIFQERKKYTNFEEQKGTRYIRGDVYIGIIIFNCFSSKKPCLRFLLNSFVCERKDFYQSSFRHEIDFRDIMNVSLNILAKNYKKTILSLKILVSFCLRKKRSGNALLTLTVNNCKIIQKNKLCHSKQQ